MTRLDVFVVGGAGVDHVVRVPALPLPLVDSLVVPPILTYVGHTGNGVALGCRALGLASGFADVLGDDQEGQLIRAAHRTAGLHTWYAVHQAGTRRAVNLVDPSGRRLSLYDPRQSTAERPDPALWRTELRDARHVHVSIMDWARVALADAVAAGRPTSTDLHDWDGADSYHRDFAYGADLVFCSAARLGDRVDAVLADILGRGRAAAAIATDGERGSRLAVRDARIVTIPALSLPGRPVVDSNGAGDSYVAAFLWAVLNGAGYPQAALAGAIAGAYACGTAGTHTSFITAGELVAEQARCGEMLGEAGGEGEAGR